WKAFYLALFILFITIGSLSKIFKNDFFFIYKSVELNHNNVFVPFMDNLSVLKRLTYEPAVWIFNQYGYIFIFILALPSLFISVDSNKEHSRFISFWKFYFIILLITYWWGTTSIHRFAPILLLDRMWMLLLVPLSIFASETIRQIIKENSNKKAQVFL